MAVYFSPHGEALDESDYYTTVNTPTTIHRAQTPKFPSPFDFDDATPPAPCLLGQYLNPIGFSPDPSVCALADSPRTVVASSPSLSYSSTAPSSVSLSSDDCDADGDVHFSVVSDDDSLFHRQLRFTHDFLSAPEDLEPPASPRTADSFSPSVSPADVDPPTPSRPGTPSGERAEDDLAVQPHPSRHVDYLSHDWKEEDLWTSWKYIVSRRGEVSNGARLENASWRSWMKAKYKLSTVSPDKLNWLKDCDVTWLYGPLQPGTSDLFRTECEPAMSPVNSFVINKKPILKKRSLSEIMLLESLSASSLLKQATAAVQAQVRDGRAARDLLRSSSAAATDYLSLPLSSRMISGDASTASLATSSTSSGFLSPTSGERRHIQFNEQVEQCIAVDIRCDVDDVDDDEDGPDGEHRYHDYEDSDSDDGDGIVMAPTHTKKRTPFGRKPTTKRRKSSSDSRIIAMLPSTTLKYRDDAPEPVAFAGYQATTPRSIGAVLSRSSSQETLRPAAAGARFFFGDDDDDEDMDDWQMPNFSGPPQGGAVSLQDGNAANDSLMQGTTSPAFYEEPAGMRRTASGMFMPVGEEDHQANESIFGRVIEVVNTAKDIGHVIWNVGWSGR